MAINEAEVIALNAHESNLHLQAEQHPLVDDQAFTSIEGYVNYLIHLRAYEEAAQFVVDKAVLDVGCNVGYGVKVLASKAASVAGIDVSAQAVEAAKQRLGSTADIRLYDGVQSTFSARMFDVTTSFQVIEHVSDYEAYFSEIIRLLRPGGTAVFSTPNSHLRLDLGMKPWNEFHVREFSPSELEELLLMWFEQVEVRGLFGKDDIYEIERNRCDKARVAARQQTVTLRQRFRTSAKNLFPWLVPLSQALRPRKKPQPELAILTQTELGRFTTQDLFYKNASLDEALDLMAICRGPRAHRESGSAFLGC